LKTVGAGNRLGFECTLFPPQYSRPSIEGRLFAIQDGKD